VTPDGRQYAKIAMTESARRERHCNLRDPIVLTMGRSGTLSPLRLFLLNWPHMVYTRDATLFGVEMETLWTLWENARQEYAAAAGDNDASDIENDE
jgi:hypothetical protein